MTRDDHLFKRQSWETECFNAKFFSTSTDRLRSREFLFLNSENTGVMIFRNMRKILATAGERSNIKLASIQPRVLIWEISYSTHGTVQYPLSLEKQNNFCELFLLHTSLYWLICSGPLTKALNQVYMIDWLNNLAGLPDPLSPWWYI